MKETQTMLRRSFSSQWTSKKISTTITTVKNKIRQIVQLSGEEEEEEEEAVSTRRLTANLTGKTKTLRPTYSWS